MATDSTNSQEAAKIDLNKLTPAEQRELLQSLLQAKAEQSRVFPMSPGQQGLWHAFRRNPQATPFNVFLPTRVRASLNTDVLRKSFELTAQRHACLRTTFSDVGGELQQTVHKDLPPEFRTVELSGASESEVQAAIRKEMVRPFDLEKGPLMRVVCYRLAAEDWVIFVATHHIVVDFWSLVITFSEMRVIYPAILAGMQPDLPVASNNYGEFVQRQLQCIDNSQMASTLKSHWQEKLSGISPVLELPTDFNRPQQFSHRADIEPIALGSSIASLVNSFANEHRVTPFAIVHSALQVFLSRYSGQKEFFIGSPFSGRSSHEFEKTVGFFVNMLPLPVNLANSPSFVELTQRTASNLLDALEHESYPIGQIIHDAEVARDATRSPLFQVSCTFEKAQIKEENGRAGTLFPGHQRSWDFAGMHQEGFYVPHPTCHYDLEFIFEQTDNELRGMICYCSDLFSEKTAKHLSKNFALLLEALLGHATIPIDAVRTNQNPAPRKIESLANTSAAEHTVDRMILRHACEESKDGNAFHFNSRRITYANLAANSQQLADRLKSEGVNSGDMVPVIGTSGPDVFAAMLAVNQVGAAFVPVDSNQPSHSLEALVREVKAPFAICTPDAAALNNTELEGCNTLQWELTDSLHPDQFSEATSESKAADLAYLVFTSGSTGKPKGVMVQHSAVCNTLNWREETVPLGKGDRVLMLLSHQFDAGLAIAWTTITQGATLVWADSASRTDPSQLIDQIIQDEITVLPAVPSLLRLLVNHPRFPDCQNLRYIWTGGEAMPPELPRQIRSVSQARFWNFYGPTEAAIEATACEMTQHNAKKPVPIGTPISGAEVLILDKDRRPVPDTMPGEIAIGGRGLAVGYLNSPELTQEKFIAHPLDPSGRSRVYLTGDRGRFNADGAVEFFGRTDHQVKLRGYRIELGEIESIIGSHYLVDRVAVKIAGEGTDRAQMLAFVSLDENVRNKESAGIRRGAIAILRRFASEQLPAYKLPSALMLVDEMPVTSSGKVDRSQLPDSVPEDILLEQRVEPKTAIEKYLAEQWCEVLDKESLGANINFFDAGGSSLQAAMLTSQLSEDLEVHVPTALIFDLADITQMATRLVELYPAEMTNRFGAECIEQQVEQSGLANQGDGTSNSELVSHPLIAPLKPSGPRPPIFMVHPPGGIVMCYRELSMHLPKDQPLFAIRSHGLHGDEKLPDSIERMAAAYVAALRQTRPHGPYVLGGWSLGGLIAYEMAKQLLAKGEPVTRLIMLDTTIPAGSTELVPAEEQVNVGLEYGIDLTLEELSELPPEEQLPFLWDHAKKLGVLDDNSSPEVVAQALEDLQGLFSHHVECSSRYKLEPLDIDLALYRPSETPQEIKVAHDRGWGHLVDRVQVDFVPGHHHSMVQSPNVEQLADKIGDLGL